MQGTEIGSWVLETILGGGGMGEVWLARHKTLGTPAAVKVLKDELANAPEFRDRFFQEASTQAPLRHAYIAQVLDYIDQDGRLHLVIEYLPGGTLADIVKNAAGPVDMSLALAWSKQALALRLKVFNRHIRTTNEFWNLPFIHGLGCAGPASF